MASTTMTTVPWWPRVSLSAVAEVGGGDRADGPGAEPGGDLDQVDRQVVAVQPGGLVAGSVPASCRPVVR